MTIFWPSIPNLPVATERNILKLTKNNNASCFQPTQLLTTIRTLAVGLVTAAAWKLCCSDLLSIHRTTNHSMHQGIMEYRYRQSTRGVDKYAKFVHKFTLISVLFTLNTSKCRMITLLKSFKTKTALIWAQSLDNGTAVLLKPRWRQSSLPQIDYRAKFGSSKSTRMDTYVHFIRAVCSESNTRKSVQGLLTRKIWSKKFQMFLI